MKVVQFGAGRIGNIHARNIVAHPRSTLVGIVDPYGPGAEKLASETGAAVWSEDQAFNDPSVDAIVIASSTDRHADQIEAAASAGKAIFCEKPIDLSIDRVQGVVNHLDANPVPLMLAFNRRFDPNFQEMKAQIAAGAIGDVEMVTILSRDPSAPPEDYIKVSGGLYRDMMIHDFDMARWLVGEEFGDVAAYGSALTDPAVARQGDVDTAVVTMRTATGKLAHISNSRRAAYGYDQRIEVHGSKGMVSADNVRESTVVTATADGVRYEKPMHFFLERYTQAYINEWDGFVRLVLDGDTSVPNATDGLRSLELAEKALAFDKG